MTEKEMKRLSRAELLELLLAEAEENRKLRKQLKEAQNALEDRKIAWEQAGTLAEAALRINQVFEAADRAAKQYLDHIRMRAEGSGDAS